MKQTDLNACQTRLAEVEPALDEIRAAVWMPHSTLPMVRHRVALILQKLSDK